MSPKATPNMSPSASPVENPNPSPNTSPWSGHPHHRGWLTLGVPGGLGVGRAIRLRTSAKAISRGRDEFGEQERDAPAVGQLRSLMVTHVSGRDAPYLRHERTSPNGLLVRLP